MAFSKSRYLNAMKWKKRMVHKSNIQNNVKIKEEYCNNTEFKEETFCSKYIFVPSFFISAVYTHFYT